jgi:murein DD-endopeptidase MepM/ murein hydrolase activator NlpD
MITEASPEPGRPASSGRNKFTKHDAHSPLSAQSAPHHTEAEDFPQGELDSTILQSQASLAARTPFGGLPSIGAPVAAPDGLTRALTNVQTQVQQTLADQVTPLRLAGHLSVLLIAATILILSQIKIPQWELSLQPTPLPTVGAAGAMAFANTQADGGLFDPASLRRNAVFTFVDKKAKQEAPRQDITYYTVKPGDTVLDIAKKYGLQPETLMWSNSNIEQNPDRLSVGDELRILPVDGVLHVVEPGETLSSLADDFNVELQAIVGYTGNSLDNEAAGLSVGKELVIPGGTKAFATVAADMSGAYMVDTPANAPQGSGDFSWPAAGYVSQGYWGGHPAVDLAGYVGAAVTAADGGYVVLAGGGWNGGYGNHVIIDHGNGFSTLYAHLNSIFVSPGMTVSKGQQLGTMGNTGNSTGPHLHFEVRYGGVPYNPSSYLK